MKKILAMALALCMVLSMIPAALAAESGMTAAEAEAAVASLNANSDFYYELAENYADSDIEHRTEVRWWMAEGGHTDETLEEEVQAMYDAGFRGVELCQLSISMLDETVWGYGSEQWNHDFHVVLNKCMDLGMTVGITSGTNWNTSNIPGLDPDTQEAMQAAFELHETVAPGQVLENHPVPTSNQLRAVNHWIGAYAYEIVDENAKPIVLGKPIDLNEFVTIAEDGTKTLTWTAPEGENSYYIFYYWMQATAQESSPSVVPAYCINYLDKRGFEAWAEYFKANVLNDPALNEKILKGDVQLFMDSLEYSFGRGFTLYSEQFAEEFQARKGYDIRPYLLLAKGLPGVVTFNAPQDYVAGTYNLADPVEGQKILNDLHDVQTKLYMENLLIPLEAWLNDYGIQLRVQISYGKYLEISEPSMVVDYPEAENLNQRNQVDIYRLWSGAAKLENKILSSETGALGGYAYAFTHQKHMQEAYSLYAAGFSRINWHIWTSQWAPSNLVGVTGGGWGVPVTTWPGFQSMSMFNCLGMREPGYDEYWQFNQHLGRVQELLREGVSRTDIGMPRIKYGQEICFSVGKGEKDMWMQRHDYMLYPSMELQENGYTYDYFSPEILNSEDVYYNAETGTLELAGYKALVLWQNWLSVDGAQNILDFAKQGLKIVIVGDACKETPYQDGDAQLKAIMDEMKTLDNVVVVETADDVMEALQAMGVVPYAGFESQQLLTQVREDDGNLFLYAYNYCDGTLHDETCTDHGLLAVEEVTMDGTFIPYYIDAWTGEVTQVADYRWENGQTIFELSLEYGDIALYAFEAVENEPEHVVSTEADAFVTEDGIVLRATESGTYKTELAYGRSFKTDVVVPAAYDITNWDVTVESWTGGDIIKRADTFTDSNGVTGEESCYATVKTPISFKLDTLTTWDNIPEVGKEVSGRGEYKATFNWDAEAADGAYIDFGVLCNGMTVKINGVETTDVNMNDPVLDAGAYLVDGENTIEISYGSTLTNVLLAIGKIRVGNGSWGGYRIDYRSYGPAQAVVVPYVEENISVLENTDVTVQVAGAADVTLDVDTLTYDVTVSGAENLATATLTFAVGALDAEVVAPEGWSVMRQSCVDGILTAVLYNLEGVSGEALVASVVAATPDEVGKVAVELTEAELSAYVGDGETFVNVVFGETLAETEVKYHTCDVNRDGVVNQLDITRAQRFFGAADEICDVTGDGLVNTADMILILNSYTA